MANRFRGSINKRIQRASRRALAEIARRLKATVKDLINVRVQYTPGWVIRSDPGEPPRREFGNYYRSIRSRVENKGLSVDDMVVFSTTVLSVYLEYGTEKMEPRPHWKVAVRMMGGRAGLIRLYKQLVAQYLREGGGSDFTD